MVSSLLIQQSFADVSSLHKTIDNKINLSRNIFFIPELYNLLLSKASIFRSTRIGIYYYLFQCCR